MIAPADTGSAPAMQRKRMAEAPKNDTAPGGGFASIMAATRSGGDIASRRPGDWAPLLEPQDGRGSAGAAMTDTLTGLPEGSLARARNDAADRFDEHGLLRLMAEAAPAAEIADCEPATGVAASPQGDMAETRTGPGNALIPVDRRVGAGREPSVAPQLQPAALAAQARGAEARLAYWAQPLSGEPMTEGDVATEVPARPGGRRQQLRGASASPVEVALRESDQGLAVGVRSEGLEAGRHAQLKDEILASLARHGLRPGEVRINGRAPSRARREED